MILTELKKLQKENKVLTEINARLEMQLAEVDPEGIKRSASLIPSQSSHTNSNDIETLKAANRALEDKVSVLNEEKEAQQREMAQLKDDFEFLKGQVVKLRNEKEALQASQQSETHFSTAEVVNLNAEIASLKDMINKLNAEKEILAKKSEEVSNNNEIEKLRQRNKYLSDHVAKLQVLCSRPSLDHSS